MKQHNKTRTEGSLLHQYQKITYSPFFSFASSKSLKRNPSHWVLVQQVGLRVLLLAEQ
jgi:hypothetical protein